MIPLQTPPMNYVLLLSALLLTSVSVQAEPTPSDLPSTLTLGATEWCPYTCSNRAGAPGIVAEYLQHILQSEGIELDVMFLPWSRAVSAARSGQLDGLLTLVAGEAGGLLMTKTPTMFHQDCFFTTPDSDWQFADITSLQGILLGAVKDYGYGGRIDSYIASRRHDASHVLLLNGRQPELRLQKMLASQRIQVYLSDRNVAGWTQRQSKDSAPLRNAGCEAEVPFFLGLSPLRRWSKTLLEMLNKRLASPASQQLLRKIAAEYR